MRKGSWQAGTSCLAFAALLGVVTTAAAQSPLKLAPAGRDPPGVGGECAEKRERAVLGPQGCGQEPMALPTLFRPVPDPGSNVEGSRGEERARDVLGRLRSPEYLNRLEAEKTRLQLEVFGNVLEAFPETAGFSSAGPRGLPPTERIYLFISESVPVATLRNYARDIAEIEDPGIVVVLRGFVGGMRHVLPTRRFVLGVLRKDLACDPETWADCELYPVNLVIDPLLFRRYDVQEVPAVVYAQGVEIAGDASEGLPVHVGADRFWRLSGDAGLDALLRRINEDAKSAALTAMLAPNQ